MFLWSVAILELDSHPDQMKGLEPITALVLRPFPFTDPNHIKKQAHPLIARPLS